MKSKVKSSGIHGYNVDALKNTSFNFLENERYHTVVERGHVDENLPKFSNGSMKDMLNSTSGNSTGAVRKIVTARRRTRTSTSNTNVVSNSDEFGNGNGEEQTQLVQESVIATRKLNVISQNMRSLNEKQLKLELVARKFSADVILLCEHWLKQERLEQIISSSYKLVASSCRERRRGGGVAIFVKDDIHVINRNDILELDVHIEYCGVELTSVLNLVMVAVYRPPSSKFKTFKEKLAVLLETLYNSNKLVILGGDINIDYQRDHAEWQELFDLCGSFNFCWTTKEPTRVTNTNSNCLDNFFVNFPEDVFEMLVSDEKVSDHRTLVLKNIKVNGNSDIYNDRFNLDHLSRFKNLLKSETWTSVYQDDCPSAAFTKFREIFSSYNSRCFSEIKLNKLQIGSCINEEIRDSLFFFKDINSRHPLILNDSKKYDLFFKEFSHEEPAEDITNFVSNMSKLERYIIRRYINMAEIPIKSNLPDNMPNILCKKMGQHFINALIQVYQLRDNNNANYSDIKNFMLKLPAVDSSILLTPITNGDVEIIIRKLSTSTTAGYDDIPSFIVKYSSPVIVPILTKLINDSFRKGTFPSELKTYLIKPLFVGKGDYNNLECYHIFVQSVFTKLYEAAMTLKIINYLNEFNLIHSNYTDINLGLFTSLRNIYSALDKGKFCLGLYLDLSTIFDTIVHNLLMHKLKYYGFKNRALKWIKSYLEYREYNNIGLPKNSILSDTLFKIYTNDLIHAIEGIIVHTLNLIVPIYGDTLEELKEKTKNISLKLKEWISRNKLLIHKKELQYIYFYKKRQPITTLCIDNKTYKITSDINILGVTIDKNLDWKPHVTNICASLSKMNKALVYLRENSSIETAKILYFYHFVPCMRYGIIFWGALITPTKKIFTLQNRALKIIYALKQSFNKHDFKHNSILTLYDIYILDVLYFVHKNKIEFSQSRINHMYETRNKNNLVLPQSSTTAFQKSVYYLGCQLYNILPVRFKTIDNLGRFKKEVEKYLLEINCFSIEDFLKYKHN